MSAEFPLDVRRDEDEEHPCDGPFHEFPADAKDGDSCYCGECKW